MMNLENDWQTGARLGEMLWNATIERAELDSDAEFDDWLDAAAEGARIPAPYDFKY